MRRRLPATPGVLLALGASRLVRLQSSTEMNANLSSAAIICAVNQVALMIGLYLKQKLIAFGFPGVISLKDPELTRILQ